MKITPLDLRKKKFKKSFRGYDCEDVSVFLSSLSREWERLQLECRAMADDRNKVRKELEKLKEVETTMFKALKSAESAGTERAQKASKSADLQVREAKMKTEVMLQKAKEQASKVLEETKREAHAVLQSLQQELRAILHAYESVKEEKEHLVMNVKTLVEGVLKKTGVLHERVEKNNLRSGASKAEALQNRVEERLDALQGTLDSALPGAAGGGKLLSGKRLERKDNFFDNLS